jgi:rfaE bifunctional protein nucleotidyltransferase chain/domain
MKPSVRNLKLVNAGLLPNLGNSIVATNGCFDLLHPGHVYFLQEAAKLGCRLVVGINSDRSVRALKGEGRPIFPARLRAYVIASLSCVSFVYIFDSIRATTFLRALRPKVWVKGGDYTIDTVDKGERDAVLRSGGSIQFIPSMPGFSTTRITKLL